MRRNLPLVAEVDVGLCLTGDSLATLEVGVGSFGIAPMEGIVVVAGVRGGSIAGAWCWFGCGRGIRSSGLCLLDGCMDTAADRRFAGTEVGTILGASGVLVPCWKAS